MNIWLVTASVLLVCLMPCGMLCLRGAPEDRLVGLEASGVIGALALLVLAEGFHCPACSHLGLALALLTFGSGLVFARFLERWM
jgi:multicomponent Na+:H+ antiporter subunit F